MRPATYTPTDVLRGIVRQRAKLQQMGKGRHMDRYMATTMAFAQDLLAKAPNDRQVAEWIRQRRDNVLALLPSTDKNRRQYISTL